MKVHATQYSRARGWEAPLQPALDGADTLVLVFGASCLDLVSDGLEDLAAAYPLASVVGCSTAGEVFETQLADDTLSVGIARFEHSRLRVATAPVHGSHDSHAAGASIAAALRADDLRGIVVFSDGLATNGTELLRGMNAGLPAGVAVTGGMAGDGNRFRQTWVLAHGKATSARVAGVGIYGARAGIGHGTQGGWDKFGIERVVTRSEANVLFELDGRPALALYKQYLGPHAADLPASALLFPLGMRSADVDGRVLVRAVMSVCDADQSMTFAGDIPQGARVQLMHANFDRLIEGASEAGRLTTARSQGTGESLAVAVSCVARRKVLGERTEEELEAARQTLPPSARLIGFYSYGEISPLATGPCDLHNQTMTLTHLWES